MRHAEELIEPHEQKDALQLGTLQIMELDRLQNWANIAAGALADAQERLGYIVKTLRGEKVK